MEYIENLNKWLNSDFVSDSDKEILKSLSDDELREKFYKNLEFGTAGLRGIMGLGSNLMNKYTVCNTTQGLADYINLIKHRYTESGVVIAYDSRNNSKYFNDLVVNVLNSNGIKTYMFDDITSTPMLSYAVRKLNCLFGIVITSSHNPKEYNGYKVYFKDGGQIVHPIDTELTKSIQNVTSFDDINIDSNSTLNTILNADLFNEFIKDTNNLILNKEVVEKNAKDIKIVYTALHGTGLKPVLEISKLNNINNLYVVENQSKCDGNFTHAPYPNPEIFSNFNLGIELANKKGADIIIATDPDADRLGVACRNNKGDFELLTGNMVGAIFCEYILSHRENNKNDCVIKSIVSTDIIKNITDFYNINCLDVLTGCKYIAENIEKFNKSNEYNFVFGFEESIGYMTNSYVRDKNAISAYILFVEIVSYLNDNNMSLMDYLNAIYEKFGYFMEETVSLVFEGIEGVSIINNIMTKFRNEKINNLSQYNVISKVDYLIDETSLDKSNVLKFILDNNTSFTIRPSGTEPKIKLYYKTIQDNMETSINVINNLKIYINELINNINK